MRCNTLDERKQYEDSLENGILKEQNNQLRAKLRELKKQVAKFEETIDQKNQMIKRLDRKIEEQDEKLMKLANYIESLNGDIPITFGKPGKFDYDQREELIRDREAGMTIRALASKYNCSVNTIQKYLPKNKSNVK